MEWIVIVFAVLGAIAGLLLALDYTPGVWGFIIDAIIFIPGGALAGTLIGAMIVTAIKGIFF